MLTLEERIYTLSYLWKEAEYNFAFWAMHSEIDWNAEYKRFLPLVINAKSDLEYYLLLVRFYALLRDGHTLIMLPPALLEGRTVPFGVIRANGKFLLSEVIKGRDELLLAETAHIQGLPIEKYIENYVYPFYWHELPESLVIHLTKDNIAVIEIFDFYHAEITKEFEDNISLPAGCKGYVIDVRGNSGGMGDPPLEIARFFISGKYPVSSNPKTPSHSAKYHALEPYIDRDNPDLSDPWQRRIYEVASHTCYESLTENGEKNGYIDFDERKTVLTAPAIILTNHRTACSAEGFVSYFKITGRAKIVGTTTFGSGAEAMIRDLPLGGKIWLATTYSKLIDGSEYVNVGIAPDIPVKRTAKDIAERKDKILIKALDLLRTEKAN